MEALQELIARYEDSTDEAEREAIIHEVNEIYNTSMAFIND